MKRHTKCEGASQRCVRDAVPDRTRSCKAQLIQITERCAACAANSNMYWGRRAGYMQHDSRVYALQQFTHEDLYLAGFEGDVSHE